MTGFGTDILWVVIGAVGLGLLDRFVTRLSRSSDGWLNRVSERLPRSLLPMERTLVIVLIATLTGLILAFPDWGAWSFVVRPEHSSNISQGTRLGAAVALLASLLFAANQLHNTQKDSGKGRMYLGENAQTFGASRSRATRLLRQPVFHLAVAALFFLPLVQPTLPTEATTPAIGPLPAISLTPQALALASWSACFAVVGGTLIFNALGALRSSATGIISPQSVDWSIEDGVKETSRAYYSRLFKQSKDEGYFYAKKDAERWVKQQLDTASTLPYDEQEKYLQLTVDAPVYVATIERFEKAVKRAFDAPELTPIFWNRLRQRVRERRQKRALYALEKSHNVAYGKARALLQNLNSRGLADDTKQWIASQCLYEARMTTEMHGRAIRESLKMANSARPCAANIYLKEVERILLSPESNVPTLDINHLDSTFNRTPGPKVEMLPLFIIKSLSGLLSTRDESRRIFLPERTIEQILETADGINDNATRKHALREAVEATISAAITHRHTATVIPSGILRPYMAARSHVKTEETAAISNVIEQCAFNSLLSPHQDPAATRELLELIAEWRVPAAILYQLHQAQRSHNPLPFAELFPYYEALSRYRSEYFDDVDNFITDCANFLCNSRINYFVTREGVTWLLESLRSRFTLTLCSEFFDQQKCGKIREFGLREFLLWRLAAGRVDEIYASDSKAVISAENRSLINQAMPELQAILKGWRAVDRRAASLASIVFSPL